MTDNLPPNPTPTGHALRQWLVSLGLLALLTLAMFGNVLFTTDPVVLSNSTTDIRAEYLHWRAFGFDQLRHGNLALWNPDLFCGTPFFGGFQAALLYPPNVLFLILPVGSAINWCIALHVFLAGVFMCVWARWRGLCQPAAFLAGVIYMFCGANFLHVYSGYLPYLCALVWPPLLFLAIDGLMEAFALRWVLLGMFAVAMQVLAGNPQSVFYAGVAAGIYCLLGLFRARDWKKIIVGSLGLALGGVALGAVQLFTGLDESHDMLRNAGVPYDFAAMFSFPPENFLTLLAPHFFGDLKTLSYWGRDYLWEMCLFIGVTGLVLAVLGAVWGGRRRWVSVVMVAVLLLLALGGHTPLFKLLYHWVPGFNQFRGNSKFIFLASMFLALLAGGGMDELLRGRRPPRGLICGVTLAGAALIAFSVAVRPTGFDTPTAAWWHSFLQAVHRLGETYLPASTYNDPTFLLNAGRLACRSLFIAGLLLAAVALLLGLARKHRLAVWSLLALAVVELSVFARTSLDQFDLDTAVNKEVKSYLAEHPGNYRILNQEMPDAALSLGAQDMWGYEPGIVRRFAQLMAFVRGINPDEAVRLTSDVQIIHGNPLFDLFRCRYDFIPDNGRLVIYEHTNAFPQLLLVQRCRVLADRAKIFSTLTNTAFNPRQEVILEKAPDPQPVVSKDPGQVKLVDSGTDFLTVEADVKTPSILLVTDVYAHGWRARGLAGSVQKDYRIQPADWCLRGIPLAAGHHRLRLEYRPTGFVLGKWVSIFSWLMFLPLAGAMAWRFARNARLSLKPASPASEPSAAESPAPLGDWQWEFKLAPEDRTLLTVLAALVIATFFSYWPVFGADFTNYDDPVYVTENAHVLQGLTWQSFSWAFTNLDAGFWHPLTWLSLLTDMTFYGYYKDAALGFHLTNVLLHIGSTVLLFLVLRRTTGALWRSAIVAALFALHPLHVESVAWVTERKDVLSTFFWMLTLWFYVRYADARQPGAPWTRRAGGNYLLVVLFLCCGLMSKTMLVTLPGVLLAMDYWPLGRVSGFGFGVSGSKTRNPKLETRNWLSLVLEKLPLLALAILAAWGTIRSEAHVGALPKAVNSPLFLRLENTSLNYFRYVFEMFWPSGLTVFYPYPKHFSLWAVMGALSVTVLITILALRWWQRRPYFIAGWLWYCMTLLPVSGIIQVGSHVAADRYTYVPLTGLFIVVVWGGAEILSRRRCSPVEITGLTALMLGACAFLTVNQARYWETSETLFRHALAVTKNNHIANNNLATYLHQRGKVDEAMPYYMQAVEIDPSYSDALNNLGYAYQGKKEYTNALACYAAAIQSDPNHVPAHYNLGLAYGDLGQYTNAIAQFQQVLQLKPDNVSVRYHMADALVALGRTNEAIEQYQAVSKMAPNNADDLNDLGFYLAGQGDWDRAMAAYHQALEFNPYHVDALNNLGNALAAKKEYPEAITYYDNTLHLNPYYAPAHYNWGNALLNLGKTDEAVAQYQAAINTYTNYPEAHYQLGKVLVDQGQAAQGIHQLRLAVQFKPEWAEGLNNLAWVLATNPDAKSRNGADAVKLAAHAVDLTHRENSGYLDTLAAAQAEAGDFTKAAQTEQEAIELEKASGTTNNDGAEMLAHLRLFQAHQAVSETVH